MEIKKNSPEQIEARKSLKQDIKNLILERNLSFRDVDFVLGSLFAEFRDKGLEYANAARIKDINK